ncbi:MAG: hypothetical protein IPK67_04130 [Planctomycetes bacterium]|nr:hypothetical protein [Planctomycetota bacterium]
MGHQRIEALLALFCAPLAAAGGPGTGPVVPVVPVVLGASRAQAQEAVLVVDLIDNGSGALLNDAPPGDGRARQVPWWIASGPPRNAPSSAPGLVLAPGQSLSQPFAAYGPLAREVRVSGRVAGRGRVRWRDAREDPLELEVVDGAFELTGAQFLERTGREPTPRFLVELSLPEGSTGATFTDIQARVPLPLPTEEALAEELAGLCDRTFKTWLERGIDREGPRPTAFLIAKFDAQDGSRIAVDPSGIHPLYECLLDALAVREEPLWRAGLEAYLKDFFELAFHPETGMPREWDGVKDEPLDQRPIEIARYLTFLLDLEDHGPELWRERALAQARRVAAQVMARGRLGDGSIAVKYLPVDASPDLRAQPIRRLDVAAQLARLGQRTGDRALVDAANAALAEFTYTLYWGGTWERIDPDFDDSWGTWGGKAVTLLAASPEDPLLSSFVSHGFRHFAPLWRDAARFGGSMAADQTRCWDLALRYAEVEPAVRGELDVLLHEALRAHFKGEQYPGGAWGDVTFAAFSPRATLNVGDFTGTPANLIQGLAMAYRRGSKTRTDETRALFTAVLRASEAAYGRKHGWLSTREPVAGRNLAFGELRAAVGAVEMLECLAR